nr:hypothetical protein [Tanacetum cinerariifolium]
PLFGGKNGYWAVRAGGEFGDWAGIVPGVWTYLHPFLVITDLWNHCEKHGTVADVYIAQKLSKIRRRFAFVRFLKVKNIVSLLESLNKIWIGSYHIFAAKARFERKLSAANKTTPNQIPKTLSKPQPKVSAASHANPSRSYATALNGKTSNFSDYNEKFILKSVTLDKSDLIDTPDLRKVIFIKVRDVHLILNINNVLKKEGFFGFKCKYIVWIEIGGLPLNAWTSKAFKKIAENWGEPLFVDEDPQENVATGRVCIKTRIQDQISETCKVMIHDKSFNVRIKEFVGWVPDIKDLEYESSTNSEADNSDDLEVNDRDDHEVEEGEIPFTTENHNVEIHKPTETSEVEVVMNTQWPNGAEGFVDPQNDAKAPNQPSKETQGNQKEDSESISKPPGFEGYKNHYTQKSNRPSASSFTTAKNSRISKSHSKSHHGSMIDAFISHIKIGNVLGYDMEGSKNDLKKFIDSIGGKQGQL